MFERFTDEARRLVVLAQEQARLLGHDYIGSEHLLLGVIALAGTGAAALAGFGIDRVYVEAAVMPRRPSTGQPSGHIPFTAHAKKTLELSLREALGQGSPEITPGHLLLGLLAVDDSLAVEIIVSRPVDLAALRAAVIAQLDSEPRGTARISRARQGRVIRSPAPSRTLAAARLDEAAERLAGSGLVGSQHLVEAALADPSSAASKALLSLGVTPEQAVAALRAVDVEGTSDETPNAARLRQLRIRVTPDLLTLETTDALMIQRARRAAGVGATAEPGEIVGGTPETASLARVLSALSDSLRAIAGSNADPEYDEPDQP